MAFISAKFRFPLICIFLFQLWVSGLYAQSAFDVAKPLPVASALRLPGSMAGLSHTGYFASHALPYGMLSLSRLQAGVGAPVGNGGLGFSLERSGIEGFLQHRASGLVASNMGGVTLAGRASLHQIQIAEQETRLFPTVDLHSFLQISERLYAGGYIENLLQQPSASPLPSEMRLGICQLFSNEVSAYINLQKVIGQPISPLAGIVYRDQALVALISYQSHPHQMQVGLGIEQTKWSFMGQLSRHEALGLSFQWVFQWKLPRKEEPGLTQN